MTPRGSKDAKGEILAAASALFEQRGIDGLSMRQIAAEIGVSATAIYHHFDDKNAMMAAVCAAGFEEFGARLAATASEPTPLDALRAAGREYVDFALTHPMHYDVMMVRPHEWALGPHADADPESFAGLLAMVSAAQAAGQLSPGDPREAAHMLWAALHGVVSLALSMPGEIAGLEPDAVRARGVAVADAVLASLGARA